MAHGMAGVISFLTHCLIEGVDSERASDLLRGALVWFKSRATLVLQEDFPRYLVDETGGGGAMQGWCWGGLGAAWALYQAACVVHDPDVERMALQLAVLASRRRPRAAGDACLCHGAVGSAHIFAKFHAATGDGLFERAAIERYEQALSFRSTGLYGGFVFNTTNDFRQSFGDSPRLMFGAVGVALGLIAALNDRAPTWDRLMLLSPPLPGRGRVQQAALG
jgi:hypothetical protein